MKLYKEKFQKEKAIEKNGKYFGWKYGVRKNCLARRFHLTLEDTEKKHISG